MKKVKDEERKAVKTFDAITHDLEVMRMNPQNVIDLAIAYTKETAGLKDYQVPTRKSMKARRDAVNGFSCLQDNTTNAIRYAEHRGIYIEDCDPADPTIYIWALVPEYDTHKKAKVILRRIGTMDGEMLLPQDKRHENSLKINEEARLVAKSRNQMTIISKLRNYESQMKRERMRLQEQIRNGDKVYMEASGIELKRIMQEAMDDLDEFLCGLRPNGCPF